MAEQGWAANIVVTPGAVPILRRPGANHMAVVPTDRSGNIRLTQELRSQLGLAPTTAPPSGGYFLAPGPEGTQLAFLITLIESNTVEGVIRDNLLALFGHFGQHPYAQTARIWLPLMGIEGAGLTRGQSLNIILDAVRGAGLTSREDIRFVVATSPGIELSELIALRTEVETAAGREPADVRQALASLEIKAAEETISLLDYATYLMLGQHPGYDNGRISTRVFLAALVRQDQTHRSSMDGALFVNWANVSSQIQAAVNRYFRDFPEPGQVAPPPAILSREFTEALRMATQRADGASITLSHLIDAVLEQAERDPPGETAARRLLDEAKLSAKELRSMLIQRGAAGNFNAAPPPVPEQSIPPSPRDFYTRPFTDRPSQLSETLLARAEAVALARLAALKETQAPLAIGIFGDWGAGKSSFMETVESIVGGLQGHVPYCDRIIQIRFNAWHYIETNLWASLVSHIFAELDAKLREVIGEQVDTLYSGLATAQRQEIESARQLVTSKVALDKARADAQRTLAGETENGALGFASLARDTFRTFYEQLSTSERQRLDRAVSDLGITDGREAWQRAEAALAEAQSLVGRARLLFGEFRHSWQSRDVAPLMWAGVLLLTFLVAGLFGAGVARWLGGELGVFSGIGAAALGAATALSRLPSVAGGVLSLFERAYRHREEAHRVAVAAIEKEIASRQAQLVQAAADFGGATPFARITRFIRDKAADEVYARHLGLVAMIRRDFETLTKCIVNEESISAAQFGQNAEEAKIVTDAHRILAEMGQPVSQASDPGKVDEGLRPFGRIILYIDDLDRCTTDKVVEVLQAVHLLLAFELFIVVVAVDYRWIRSALAKAYRGQLKRPNNRDVAATAADYLEKIFQIPYWVRRLDPTSSQAFLSDLIAEARKVQLPRSVKPDDVIPKSGSVLGHEAPVNQTPTSAANETQRSEQNEVRVVHSEDDASGSTGRQPSEAWPPIGTPTLSPVPLEPIEITPDEERLLCALAPYAGNTPRQLKRFLNIYRVIKASTNGASIPWRATMVLLALATAAPERFAALIRALKALTDGDDLECLKRSLANNWGGEREDPSLAALATVTGAVTLPQLVDQAPIVARFSFCEEEWFRAAKPQLDEETGATITSPDFSISPRAANWTSRRQ